MSNQKISVRLQLHCTVHCAVNKLTLAARVSNDVDRPIRGGGCRSIQSMDTGWLAIGTRQTRKQGRR